MNTSFKSLENVLLNEHFPMTDILLRRGYHIDRDDEQYYFLRDAMAFLVEFYRRFDSELIHKDNNGFFYLRPFASQANKQKLRSRKMTSEEMIVGQFLALLRFDPKVLESVSREEIEQRLVELKTVRALYEAFINRSKKRAYAEHAAKKKVQEKIGSALNSLRKLGFITEKSRHNYVLKPALMRFVELAKSKHDPEKALQEMILTGEMER